MFELKRFYTGWRAIFIRKPKILYETKDKDEIVKKWHQYHKLGKSYIKYSIIFNTRPGSMKKEVKNSWLLKQFKAARKIVKSWPKGKRDAMKAATKAGK